MTQVGYGPLERVDGPLPVAAPYGLLQAGAAPASGVHLVTEPDDRWMNGVNVYPYLPDVAQAWDACAPGTSFVSKDSGSDVETPEFGALTIYIAERCASRKVWDQDEFKARAALVLDTVQGSGLAQEFLTGAVLPENPHLSDGNGTFPNGNSVTSVVNALALLEGEIAKSHRLGNIHMSPMAATFLRNYYVIDDRGGVLRTINGNIVIPDFGYVVDASLQNPTGRPVATGTQEWMYATGAIDIRQSNMFTTPDNVAQALERGTGGADTGRPNTIVYRAERYFLVDWDTQVQAAVLADRCSTTC